MAVHAEKRPAPVVKGAPPARARAPRRPAPIQLRGAGAVLDRAARSLSGDSPMSRPRSRSGLPDRLRAGVEALSGLTMDDVRVHRNSDAPARFGALAYTRGSDIHLGPGQDRHLPHEAWHVVQQKQGRVRATTQFKGVPVNEDRHLEREADEMGRSASQMSGVSMTSPGRQPVPPMSLSGPAVPGILQASSEAPSLSLAADEVESENKQAAGRPDLYRSGNASNPRMDNVRPKDIKRVEVDGVVHVEPNNGGISTSAVRMAGKNVYVYPSAAAIPTDLEVVNDHDDHWAWRPAKLMTLARYIEQLLYSHNFFRRP